RRKLHAKATPLGGGAAVFVATTLVVAALVAVPNPWQAGLERIGSDLVALLLAAGLVVIIGLIDDRLQLRGRQKLLGQCLAVAVLVASGLVIQRFAVFGYQVDLGLLAVPFTFFWLLGAINSVNLLDGIDGMASVLGIILVGAFAGIAALTNRPEIAVVALTFAGALCGFLRFNFPPASIFLGDAGSMLIGLVVGTLAIQGSLKGPGTVLLVAPLAVWTLPILDSAAAILRRKLTGRSIYSTDRGHLHHRLLDRFGTSRRVLAVVSTCCLVTSASAMASVLYNNDFIAAAGIGAVVVALVATGLFGQGELNLVLGWLRRTLRSLLAKPGAPRDFETAVRLQGSRQWEILWASLTESANKLSLTQVHLDVNLPLEHESYNATWDRTPAVPPDECWRLEIPLVVNAQPAGRLTVMGLPNGTSACMELDHLLDLLSPIEERLRSFAEASKPAVATAAGLVSESAPAAEPRPAVSPSK
ncbi:MAG: undecaprenyl/decaprenyl-phosphate alpha-N-acetylglucosaminyl 1-phosphate transferase, partial [Thermoguttaceae bacterium]|nr:undecaprenyl/decaprenyl-phosphate alpha-N-acetylglucosaminyl 1-phosphate transferase [Thermoguttaceae bacterium]